MIRNLFFIIIFLSISCNVDYKKEMPLEEFLQKKNLLLTHKDSLKMFERKLTKHFGWQVFVVDSTDINYKRYSRYFLIDSSDFKSCSNGRDFIAAISNLKAFVVDESLMISGNTKF